MSKGSKQRPTDKEKFDSGYDRIFKKPLECEGIEGEFIPKDYEKNLREKAALTAAAIQKSLIKAKSRLR